MGAIDQGLTAGELITLRRYSWRLIWTGLRVVAEAAESGRHNPELTARLRSLADEMPTDLEWLRPFQLLALGEHGRIVGDASTEPWVTAAAVIGTDGDPYLRSYALLRLAQAELVAGNRPAAVDAVTESAELAERLNAGPMLDQALDLIKRARLGRDTIGTDPLEAMGITSREAEVLRLVAGGRSNGQIGEELYISPKTASVHVSNILTKLGVSTRGEAAAAAYRLGLVDGASGPPAGPSKLA
jgi:DNA-binding CsgD family transcriptional regulator